ncbi:phosphoenolpyruvate synthase [Tenacibaculum adriaticum]|uniref:Phosphoenolpyruvate synthase n=1 Tax=Tenacibaculum adriaticum TaxID=413713 RepID=A0A5S5DZB7_9FLAO|nr:phosphoenolpyruvate synthase [Tenacibaculum adriaticum]TYQ00083.1 phosphoenolpyruvate synthase [Tenacibaculum adriaticum]
MNNATLKMFSEIGINDIAVVGGKNASLGEMYNELSSDGVPIPNGFATTSFAFREFLIKNNIEETIKQVLKKLDRNTYNNLNEIGEKVRKLILEGELQEKFSERILQAYLELGKGKEIDVAVRSSATAEDLPGASFAGQHESYLNIKGEANLLKAVKDCFASLYTNRAIKYREEKGFKHEEVALSVGVQKMVRADKGCSGVGFTIDPESGFKDVVLISGVWGLGENIVQGVVNPDEFYVFKPSLKKGFDAIIKKNMGSKEKTMVYTTSNNHASTMNVDTPLAKQESYVLSEAEINKLAKWSLIIEEHYKTAIDIEWAKDGFTNELFIIQARPETVHQEDDKKFTVEYKLLKKQSSILNGNAIGHKIVHGKVKKINSPKEAVELTKTDIIVTDSITPDWDPLLKKVSAIITNKGGRTSHAAIVSRELGIPALVGCINATAILSNDQAITVSCAEGNTGYVYEGEVPFEENKINFSNIKMPKTEAKIILADPDKAFRLSFYPNDGVGLMRMEFIITHLIKIHPMALVRFDKLKNPATAAYIEKLTKNYTDKREYFIDKLSQGIATICAAFYPKEVIVRLSDFKTNEYANLIGGQQFEPAEDNPMLGFRGAARYYNKAYKDGFKLECEAIKRVHADMGLTNLKVMVPFCRTVEEGKKVIMLMGDYGLIRGENGLEIYTMVEIPSNVILAEEFAEIFDGFSIGSNDLTQLTLGIDRDSGLMSNLFDEKNEAVKKMISMVIEKANKTKTKIGLCGQAPSDYPEFASFLVASGIDSISYNPDALLKGIENMNKAEEELFSKARS